MNDTSPEISKKMCEMIRSKSPIERLKMGCAMTSTSKQLITSAVKRKNPGISKTELRKELFLAFYRSDFDASKRQAIIAYLTSQH